MKRLKRGVYSLGIEDRLQRYEHVFSLAPSGLIEPCFAMDVCPKATITNLEYWSSLLPQMDHSDDLAGFQLLEIRSSLPDELLMFARQTLDGAQSGGPRALSRSNCCRIRATPHSKHEDPQRTGASGFTAGFASTTCPSKFSNARNAASP